MALPLNAMLLTICLLYQIRTSVSLTWENCDGDDVPITLKTFSIQPDPIKLPGQISIQGSVYVSKSISLLTAEITVHKKLLFWWKLPCGDSDCVYDLCKARQLGSSCSLSSGYFNFPPTTFDIPQRHLVSFLTAGQYSATIHLKSSKTNVGCIQVYFSVEM